MEEENNQAQIIPGASYYIVHKKEQCEFFRCNGFKITTTKECSVPHDFMQDEIQRSVACITFHNQQDEIIETKIASYSPKTDLHKLNKLKLDPNAKPKAIFAKVEDATSPKKKRVIFYNKFKQDLIGFNYQATNDPSYVLNSPTILESVDTSSFQEFVNNL